MRAGWDIRLVKFVSAHRRKPFEWGVNDCATFANGAVEAMTGKPIMPLPAYSTELGAAKAFKAAGVASVAELLDARLTRLDCRFPPRGAVVGRPGGEVTRLALGVMTGAQVAFLGPDGVVMSNVQDGDFFWSVE